MARIKEVSNDQSVSEAVSESDDDNSRTRAKTVVFDQRTQGEGAV